MFAQQEEVDMWRPCLLGSHVIHSFSKQLFRKTTQLFCCERFSSSNKEPNETFSYIFLCDVSDIMDVLDLSFMSDHAH